MSDAIELSIPLLKEFREKVGSREALILLQRKVGFRGMIDAEKHPTIPGTYIFYARGLSVVGHTQQGNISRKVWGIGETAELAADNLFKRLVHKKYNIFFYDSEAPRVGKIELVRDGRGKEADGQEIILRDNTRNEKNLHPYYTQTGASFIP